MEVYKNNNLSLAYSLTTETTSETIHEDLGYPDYVVGRLYYRGDIVHSAVSDGGDGRNYKLVGPAAIGYGGRPETAAPGLWEEVGGGSGTGGTLVVTETYLTNYLTNVEVSEYPTWDGSGAYEGQIFFDSADGRNYAAATAFSSAEDTTRPSAAINATDQDVAARWVLFGTANAFACLDNRLMTRTSHDDQMRMMVRAPGPCNRITFLGMEGVSNIDVVISRKNWVNDPFFVNSAPWWDDSGNATVSHLDPGTRITNIDTGTRAYAQVILRGLTIGETYVIDVTGFGQKAGGGWGDWNVFFLRQLSPTRTGPGTITHELTATKTEHPVAFRSEPGNEYTEFTRVEVYQKDSRANYFLDPFFLRSDEWWETSGNVTVSHLDPGVRITNVDTGQRGYIELVLRGLTIGTTYEITVTGFARLTGGGWGDWDVFFLRGLTPMSTGPNTVTHQVTATAKEHPVSFRSEPGNEYAEFTRVEIYRKDEGSGGLVVDTSYPEKPDSYKSTVMLSHPFISGAEYSIKLDQSGKGDAQLGLITCGHATHVGSTEADVDVTQHRVVTPTRDDYGLVSFGLGAFYKQVAARVWLPDDTGDVSATTLSSVINEACTWNLNADDTNYERLIVQGWARKTKIKTTGLSGNDYIQLDLVSLSE